MRVLQFLFVVYSIPHPLPAAGAIRIPHSVITPSSNHSTCRAFRFSTVANDYPSGHWYYCGALCYCSRNGKKFLLQKGEFLKRHQLINLLNPHLKTPSCGQGWKVRLPKVEKEDSHEWFNPKDKSIALQQELSKWNRDAEPSSAWQEERNHHFCHPELVSGSRFWV
jgi:hypothetical protein